ncbi:MAG TPA: hypothetical protein VEH27_02520 [Methylomirabilota bacterium]|nr:hypothetical protein [Methylomirabilota bacterium]
MKGIFGLMLAASALSLTHGAEKPVAMLSAWGSPLFNVSPTFSIPQVSPGARFTAVAPGEDYTAALRSDGTMIAWGTFQWAAGPFAPPDDSFTNLTAIASGEAHTVALSRSGTVREYGWNADSSALAHLTNVVAVAAGRAGRLALKADGTVAAWGTSAENLEAAAALTNITAIAAGGHNLAPERTARSFPGATAQSLLTPTLLPRI